MSGTENNVEEDPDYEASSSDENETLRVDLPVVSQLPPESVLSQSPRVDTLTS